MRMYEVYSDGGWRRGHLIEGLCSEYSEYVAIHNDPL